MINGMMTLSGAWHKLRDDPILRFLVVSLAFYGMSTFEGPMMAIKTTVDLLHAMQALSQLSYSPEFAIRRAIFRSLRQPSGCRHAHPLLGRMNMKWRPLGDSNPCYRRERAVWSRVRVPSAAPFTSPPEFTTPNSPSSARGRAAWLQREEVALPGILPSRRAAVVQSVRIPACHAGGRHDLAKVGVASSSLVSRSKFYNLASAGLVKVRRQRFGFGRTGNKL